MQDRMHEIVLGDRSLLLKLLAQLLRVHTEDHAICRERSRESAGLQFQSPDRGGKEVVVGQGGRFCKVMILQATASMSFAMSTCLSPRFIHGSVEATYLVFKRLDE